jgi:hypothetical protein
MAYVHEMKFFQQGEELYVALFDKAPLFCNEFWIKNVSASALDIQRLPKNIELEKKYSVTSLGIQPFEATKPFFRFTDASAKLAWEKGKAIFLKRIGL